MSINSLGNELNMDSHENENYVYRAEVNWSLLTEGLTVPVENQVIFARNMGSFLHKGVSETITLYVNGKGYRAQNRNVNFDSKFMRKNDTLQIRYPRNGELTQALKTCFSISYIILKSKEKSVLEMTEQ